MLQNADAPSTAGSGDRRIPEGVVERLPVYLNCLLRLRQQGASTVSSAQIGEATGVNPAQIRRDLTHFGSFGRPGVGYEVEQLIHHIQRILGTDRTHSIALVGAGNLGSAIAGYTELRKHGFIVSAVFDKDPAKVGTAVGGLEVRPIERLEADVSRLGISVGVIAVPPQAAQEVADALVRAKVRVILNYTPVVVTVPDAVQLHNSDPVRELLHTLYYLSQGDHGMGEIA